jgi:cytochrome c oxidase subunit 2
LNSFLQVHFQAVIGQFHTARQLSLCKVMIVIVGAKVRVLLTSNDVLHAWWVPELSVKKDAIPGMVNEMWFRAETAGTYRGQCAELCGKDHAYMPVVVEVVEPDAFVEWVAANGGVTTGTLAGAP